MVLRKDPRRKRDPVAAAMPTPLRVRVPVALPASPPGFDAYDAPRRPAPRRAFADVLQSASARLG